MPYLSSTCHYLTKGNVNDAFLKEGEKKMKQLIVMISMIALGIVLAGYVIGFEESAERITSSIEEKIEYESIIGSE